MIRQINVQENPTGPCASRPAGRTEVLPDELSVSYQDVDSSPLFKDFKIRPGLLLTVSDRVQSQGSRTVHETGNAPISLGFNLRHRVRCTLNSAGKRAETFERFPGDYVLSYLPGTRCLIETPPEERILGVSVHFSVNAFKDLFREIPPYLEKIFSYPKAMPRFYQQSQFNSETASILKQIIVCPYSGEIRRLFLEAKALELVALTMSGLEKQPPPSALNQREEERIREAYQILSCRIEAPPTLCELSRQIGMNRNKLNHGFKCLYGGTVFDVLRDLRLYRARDLLRDSKSSIVDIALSVGYSNQANFTTAFRRQFGKTPLAVRHEGNLRDS